MGRQRAAQGDTADEEAFELQAIAQAQEIAVEFTIAELLGRFTRL